LALVFLLGGVAGGGAVGGIVVGANLLAPPPSPVQECPPVAASAEPTPVPAAAPEPPPAPPPEPTPEPAPVAARTTPPARPAAPAPAPAPRPDVSAAVLTEVVFVGADGKRYSADAVPPGNYDILANWGSGLVKSGKVTVHEGKAVKLLCDPPTRTCTVK
jgi:hypothetical protein